MPTLRKASPKPFTKVVVSKGYGFHTPQDGSVCRIKVISDEMNIMTDLDDANEKEIIVGDVDEPTDRIIEDCIRTMKEEETCCLSFEHPCFHLDCIIPAQPVEAAVPPVRDGAAPECEQEASGPENVTNLETETEKLEKSTEEVKSTIETVEPGTDISLEESTVKDSSSNTIDIEFQLLAYTREPEIWEMSVTEKWRRASYHKQRGLELYSRGAYQYAFRRFGLTLKYVISLEHDVPSGQEEGMDIKGLKLSCYLNVAACQMRHHNFESVVINSTKALGLQPNNAKALYRRGAAHLQLQEFEKAKEDLTTAQELEPKNQAVAKQLQLLKCQVQKLNQYYASAMKKLFS